jgi:hypothetical protein
VVASTDSTGTAANSTITIADTTTVIITTTVTITAAVAINIAVIASRIAPGRAR